MKIHIVAETDVESFSIKKVFYNWKTAMKHKEELEQKEIEDIKEMLESVKKEGNAFKIKEWERHLASTNEGNFVGSYFGVFTYEVDES